MQVQVAIYLHLCRLVLMDRKPHPSPQTLHKTNNKLLEMFRRSKTGCAAEAVDGAVGHGSKDEEQTLERRVSQLLSELLPSLSKYILMIA